MPKHMSIHMPTYTHMSTRMSTRMSTHMSTHESTHMSTARLRPTIAGARHDRRPHRCATRGPCCRQLASMAAYRTAAGATARCCAVNGSSRRASTAAPSSSASCRSMSSVAGTSLMSMTESSSSARSPARLYPTPWQLCRIYLWPAASNQSLGSYGLYSYGPPPLTNASAGPLTCHMEK